MKASINTLRIGNKNITSIFNTGSEVFAIGLGANGMYLLNGGESVKVAGFNVTSENGNVELSYKMEGFRKAIRQENVFSTLEAANEVLTANAPVEKVSRPWKGRNQFNREVLETITSYPSWTPAGKRGPKVNVEKKMVRETLKGWNRHPLNFRNEEVTPEMFGLEMDGRNFRHLKTNYL